MGHGSTLCMQYSVLRIWNKVLKIAHLHAQKCLAFLWWPCSSLQNEHSSRYERIAQSSIFIAVIDGRLENGILGISRSQWLGGLMPSKYWDIGLKSPRRCGCFSLLFVLPWEARCLKKDWFAGLRSYSLHLSRIYKTCAVKWVLTASYQCHIVPHK
jgi:hypothetical protein